MIEFSKDGPLGPGRNIPGLLLHLSVSLWEIAPGNPSQRQPGEHPGGTSDGPGVTELIPSLSNVTSELPPHTALCCRHDFYIAPGQATQGGPWGQAYIRFVHQSPQWPSHGRRSVYSCWRSEGTDKWPNWNQSPTIRMTLKIHNSCPQVNFFQFFNLSLLRYNLHIVKCTLWVYSPLNHNAYSHATTTTRYRTTTTKNSLVLEVQTFSYSSWPPLVCFLSLQFCLILNVTKDKL